MKQALKMAQQMYSPNDPRVSNRRKFYADIVHQLGQQGPGSGQH